MATKKETDDKQKQAKAEDKSQDKSHQEDASTKAVAGDAGAEFDVHQELDDLMKSLEGDLSEIEPEAALGLINQWYDFLHKVKEPEVKELASGLKDLQKLVKSGKASGHEISEVLIHLGEQTSDFSGNAEKGLKQPIQRLGKQLRNSGTSIAKAEDKEYLDQIDSLVEQTQGEELTSVDPEEAVGAIDTWYNLLNKAEGDQYKQLANSLKELKQVLKRSNAKPEAIADALTQVGEQTTEIASELPRGFKGAVQKLGKQLANSGKSLATQEKE